MVISAKAKNSKQGVIRPAFTMIELIFVIVILGILSAVAIPRLAASRDDAVLVKGKAQVSAIRSGVSLQKSKRMMEGTTPFIPTSLDSSTNYSAANERLFNFADGNSSNILEYPVYSNTTQDGSWTKTDADSYLFNLGRTTVAFDYNATTGSFDCDHTNADCKSLAE